MDNNIAQLIDTYQNGGSSAIIAICHLFCHQFFAIDFLAIFTMANFFSPFIFSQKFTAKLWKLRWSQNSKNNNSVMSWVFTPKLDSNWLHSSHCRYTLISPDFTSYDLISPEFTFYALISPRTSHCMPWFHLISHCIIHWFHLTLHRIT